jgi:hypothetical protein
MEILCINQARKICPLAMANTECAAAIKFSAILAGGGYDDGERAEIRIRGSHVLAATMALMQHHEWLARMSFKRAVAVFKYWRWRKRRLHPHASIASCSTSYVIFQAMTR